MPLFGECFGASLCAGGCSSHTEQYWWELCPFRHVTQAPDKEGRPTLVGTFGGWNTTHLPSLVSPGADLSKSRPLYARSLEHACWPVCAHIATLRVTHVRFMVQCRWAFRNGEACWEGPARSALVELRCGETTKLVAVDEDGKCTYWFLLITPYACEIPFDAAERRAIEADIMQAEAQPDEHSGEQAAQSSPDEAMASTRTPRMDAGEMPQRRKTAPARKKRKKRPAESAKQHES